MRTVPTVLNGCCNEDNKCVVDERDITNLLNKHTAPSFMTLNTQGNPAQSKCAANSHSTMMRLDIYEQQEVATGPKQITSLVVG